MPFDSSILIAIFIAIIGWNIPLMVIGVNMSKNNSNKSTHNWKRVLLGRKIKQWSCSHLIICAMTIIFTIIVLALNGVLIFFFEYYVSGLLAGGYLVSTIILTIYIMRRS